MANPSKPHATALSQWLDDLIFNIFFQPDDELALKTFADGVSPDLVVR